MISLVSIQINSRLESSYRHMVMRIFCDMGLHPSIYSNRIKGVIMKRLFSQLNDME